MPSREYLDKEKIVEVRMEEIQMKIGIKFMTNERAVFRIFSTIERFT